VAYTLLLLLVLIFIHAMMVRWILVAQRRLAIQQAKQRRAAAETSGDQSSTSDTAEPDESALDIGSIGEQTRTLLRSAVFLGALIGFWLIWSDMLPALGFLEEVELWPYTVQTSVTESGAEAVAEAAQQVKYVTLHNLLVAVILALATLVLAKNIPGLLEITILKRVPLDVGGRYAVTALVRYVITVVGVIIVFGAIEIGWSKVQWLVAAMTVGLGFGLQEIFANFVSGLMLLFERPIRVGDTVTVGEVSGTVSRIRMRATTITGWDRKELVIPNKEFITGQVVNWTLSDSTLRIILPVGIAYGSDTQLAREVLFRIAREHPYVLADPEPRVLFMGFGDSSLDFELRVFVGSMDHYLKTRDELNNKIDQEFRKARIEIAFPQRDLHLRSAEAAVPIIKAEAGKRDASKRQDHKTTDE
jgi:potassium efflux system protein